VTADQRQDARLLDDLSEWFGTYIKTSGPQDLWLLALWAAHTHVVQQTGTSPRLIITSSMPGSGKTTALEHLLRLCHRPLMAAHISSVPLLSRTVADGSTLLIDEAEKHIGKGGGAGTDLLAIINSGYKIGGTWPVLVQTPQGSWQRELMSTYGPVGMAGNSPQLPDDTRSRCVEILLMPDVHETVTETDWEEIEPDCLALNHRLEAWALANRDRIRGRKVTLPPGIRGRLKECWRPLKRVAELFPGHWPGRVDQLAAEHLERIGLDREEGIERERPHLTLVRHIREIWPDDADALPTAGILAELHRQYPDMWNRSDDGRTPLTAQRMGRMLVNNYRIYSTRPQWDGPRGYGRAQFREAWDLLGVAG
jgi:hypothetical protein